MELEAKNVAPKEWMLMGEANSRSRPVNSLLEQDLEFDRIMKPAPVITEESVGSLEDLIKRRILDVSLSPTFLFSSLFIFCPIE